MDGGPRDLYSQVVTNYLKCLGLALCLAAGCDDESMTNMPTPDLSAPAGQDLAEPPLLSQCGGPGHTGNSLGVGQFCDNTTTACVPTQKAKICSAIMNQPTPAATDAYFCTFFCQATDPPGTCGEEARCICNSQACICIPNFCNNTDAGT